MRLAVQKAMFQALKTAFESAPAMTVLDHTPDERQLPVVELVAPAETEWGTDTETGADIEWSVRLWSAQRGWRESTQMKQRAFAALDRVPLALDEGHCVTCHYLRAVALEEPDGIRRSILATFRILVDDV